MRTQVVISIADTDMDPNSTEARKRPMSVTLSHDKTWRANDGGWLGVSSGKWRVTGVPPKHDLEMLDTAGVSKLTLRAFNFGLVTVGASGRGPADETWKVIAVSP